MKPGDDVRMIPQEQEKEPTKQGEEVVPPSGAMEESGWQKLKYYFWDKLSDKLILLILSGVVIFGFQQTFQHGQKVRDDAAAVAKIQTEILVKQRGFLMEAMGEYFQLLKDLEDFGRAEGEKAEELGALRKKVMVVVHTIDPIDERISKSAEPLLQKMNEISQELPTKNHEPEEIQGMSKDIRKKYMTFLIELGEITKEVIIKESGKAR